MKKEENILRKNKCNLIDQIWMLSIIETLNYVRLTRNLDKSKISLENKPKFESSEIFCIPQIEIYFYEKNASLN